MNMKSITLLWALSLASPLFAASAKFSNVVLYQPDAVMGERVGDVKALPDGFIPYVWPD